MVKWTFFLNLSFPFIEDKRISGSFYLPCTYICFPPSPWSVSTVWEAQQGSTLSVTAAPVDFFVELDFLFIASMSNCQNAMQEY